MSKEIREIDSVEEIDSRISELEKEYSKDNDKYFWEQLYRLYSRREDIINCTHKYEIYSLKQELVNIRLDNPSMLDEDSINAQIEEYKRLDDELLGESSAMKI